MSERNVDACEKETESKGTSESGMNHHLLLCTESVDDEHKYDHTDDSSTLLVPRKSTFGSFAYAC